MNILKSGKDKIGNHYFPLFLSLTITAFYLSPFIFQGDAVVLTWLDNMDSFLVWNKLAATYVGIFESSTTPIPPFMNGLPMYAVAGGFSTFFILNKIFTPFIATAVYYFILHITAVVGMYWLTNSFIAPQKKWLAAAAALAFGLQGFLPAWGLGIAGIPMMIAVYLRNRTNGFEWFMYLLIIFYAISSNVQSAGIFTIVAGFIAASLQCINERKLHWQLYAPALFLMFMFAILRGELFYQLLSGAGFASHRIAFNHPVPESNQHVFFVMWQALKNPLGILLSSGVFPFIMVVSLFPLFVINRIKSNERRLVILLYNLLLFSAFYAGIIQTTAFITWRNGNAVFKMYSLERLLIVVDIIWYLLFAFSLKYLAKYKWNVVLITSIMFAQTALHFYHATWWKAIIGMEEKYQPMAYRDYYSEEIFNKVKSDIGIDPALYKVAAFGLHPAVLQHNGFYTADGYCSNYPLTYKLAFRKIIAAELPAIVAKQKSSINDFDNWGHKVYLQSGSLFEIAHTAPPVTANKSAIVPPPKWNVEAMRQLKIKYVIAAVEINDPYKLSLQLLQQYAGKTYHIFLYKVLP